MHSRCWGRPFPFLDLPREIRDEIYYYALLCPPQQPSQRDRSLDLVIGVGYDSYPPTGIYWGTEKATRMFRVSKQVCEESISVFYSHFRFRAHGPNQLHSFLGTLRRTLTGHARCLIRHLVIDVYMRPHFASWWLHGRWSSRHLDTDPHGFPRDLMDSLPRLNTSNGHVELILWLGDFSDQVGQTKEEMVDWVAGQLMPWRAVGQLSIRGSKYRRYNAQHERLVTAVKGKMRKEEACGNSVSWGDFKKSSSGTVF